MTTGNVSFRVGSAAEASVVRRAFGDQLAQWRCRNVDDVLLVFQELVMNAVRHGDGATRVDVAHGAGMMRIEVHDHSHVAPQVQAAGGPQGGFGLIIVERLARRWGWDDTEDGKVVWSELAC